MNTADYDLIPPRSIYDVIVVGARCAGAATAMLLARGGLSVLAIDRSPYGSDTLSTHALLRGAMVQLTRWGLAERVLATGVAPVRVTTFHYGDETVPIPIKPRDGVSWLAAPRRTVLDALLVDAARSAGATVVHGPRVVDLLRGADGRVLGVVAEERDGTVRQLRAGIVIGADGRRSVVAQRVGATPYRSGTHAAAVIYGYWPGVDVAGYEWMFTPQVTGGAIPTNDGHVCLFVACPPARFLTEVRRDLEVGYFRLLSEVSPALLDVVSSSTAAVKLRGYPGEPGYVRQSVGRGWALVGDAGYFKDPITAHGITDAFRDAELLSRAVLAGSARALADYQTTRDDLSRTMFAITDEIASFSWSMDRVRALHHEMSRELNREAEQLAAHAEEPMLT